MAYWFFRHILFSVYPCVTVNVKVTIFSLYLDISSFYELEIPSRQTPEFWFIEYFILTISVSTISLNLLQCFLILELLGEIFIPLVFPRFSVFCFVVLYVEHIAFLSLIVMSSSYPSKIKTEILIEAHLLRDFFLFLIPLVLLWVFGINFCFGSLDFFYYSSCFVFYSSTKRQMLVSEELP